MLCMMTNVLQCHLTKICNGDTHHRVLSEKLVPLLRLLDFANRKKKKKNAFIRIPLHVRRSNAIIKSVCISFKIQTEKEGLNTCYFPTVLSKYITLVLPCFLFYC